MRPLSFGLVTIPVKLYTAAHTKSVSFHLLHAKDGSRIHEQMVCQAEDKPVSRDELVKGFEVSKGRYHDTYRERVLVRRNRNGETTITPKAAQEERQSLGSHGVEAESCPKRAARRVNGPGKEGEGPSQEGDTTWEGRLAADSPKAGQNASCTLRTSSAGRERL
jgi:hypothetical protein